MQYSHNQSDCFHQKVGLSAIFPDWKYKLVLVLHLKCGDIFHMQMANSQRSNLKGECIFIFFSKKI